MANQMAGQQAAATGANTQATQGEQGQILGAIGAQNNANVGMQSNINGANAGLAGTTMGQQSNLIGGAMNGLGALFKAEGGSVPNMPSTEARSMYAQGKYINSEPLTDDQWDAGKAGQQIPMAPAVPVQTPQQAAPAAKQMLDHATTQQPSSPGSFGGDPNSALYKGASSFGKFLSGMLSSSPKSSPDDQYKGSGMSADQMDQERSRAAAANAGGLPLPSADQETADQVYGQNKTIQLPADNSMAEGGKVPALVSPGEQYIPPKDVKKVIKEGKNPLSVGERIPGKPKFPGNDYRNDVVKKTLQSGGMVIPNEVMQSANPHISAMKFVHAHIAQNKHKKAKK
jgi:hypothetical protein